MLKYRYSQRIHRILAVGLFMSLSGGGVFADSDLLEASDDAQTARIELNDGSVIYGDIADIHDGGVLVSTALMGDVKIALASIKRLESDQAIELLTTEQDTFALSALTVVDGEVVLEDDDNLAVDQLDVANPEAWEVGDGYHVTGRVTSAVEFSRGNTDTDQVNLDLETTLESRRDRITVRADYEETSTNIREDGGGTTSTPTADNWQIIGKYDYFLSNPRNYLGVNLGFNSDRFAEVERRSYVGPYFGRKVFTRETLKLDAELGISYVDTDFLLSEDDSYPGVNLNLTGEAFFFDGKLKLYFRQVNLVNLSSFEQSIYRTTMGLRFPLLFGLEAAAEASADYDGGAAEGRDKLDQALKFRIGYTW